MGMTINKKKSGILVFKGDKSSFKLNQMEGFPIVPDYKYLGTTLNEEFNLFSHIKQINSKINFINTSLTPIKLRHYNKYNINLFKTFILPLYQLGT